MAESPRARPIPPAEGADLRVSGVTQRPRCASSVFRRKFHRCGRGFRPFSRTILHFACGCPFPFWRVCPGVLGIFSPRRAMHRHRHGPWSPQRWLGAPLQVGLPMPPEILAPRNPAPPPQFPPQGVPRVSVDSLCISVCLPHPVMVPVPFVDALVTVPALFVFEDPAFCLNSLCACIASPWTS